jgi:hypothetical protein
MATPDLETKSLAGLRRLKLRVRFSSTLQGAGYDAQTLEVVVAAHLREAGVDVLTDSAGEASAAGDAVLELSDNGAGIKIGELQVALLQFRVWQSVTLERVPSFRIAAPTWEGGWIFVLDRGEASRTVEAVWGLVRVHADEFVSAFRQANV